MCALEYFATYACKWIVRGVSMTLASTAMLALSGSAQVYECMLPYIDMYQ